MAATLAFERGPTALLLARTRLPWHSLPMSSPRRSSTDARHWSEILSNSGTLALRHVVRDAHSLHHQRAAADMSSSDITEELCLELGRFLVAANGLESSIFELYVGLTAE